MAIPDDGGSGGAVRLDRAGIDEWLARLGGLEERIKAQLKRELADAARIVGKHSGLGGAVEFRDRHLLALRGALTRVQNLAGVLRKARDGADRAARGISDADLRSAGDMPEAD